LPFESRCYGQTGGSSEASHAISFVRVARGIVLF
jgi:hypothetical protein